MSVTPTPSDAAAAAALEPDDFCDPGYSSTVSSRSSLLSLAASLHEFFEQHGRRYHVYFGADKNPMPNDAIEHARLDLNHEAHLLITRGRLHQAPLADPRRVLDLGTGTGVWAVDFAVEHPRADVLGIDLSPVRPVFAPANCRFETDDFERAWEPAGARFDFIHARQLAQSVADWPWLLRQARDSLVPGGYMEWAEYGFQYRCDDGTMPEDWPPKVLFDHVRRGMDAMGRLYPTGEEMAALMRDAGFVDVRLKTFKIPLGRWPKNPALKTAGNMFVMVVTEKGGYEAYGLQLLTRVLGMTAEEAVAMVERACQAHFEPDARKIHAYVPSYAVYGRRPEIE